MITSILDSQLVAVCFSTYDWQIIYSSIGMSEKEITKLVTRVSSTAKHQQFTYCDAKIIIYSDKPKPKKNSVKRLENQGKIYYRAPTSRPEKRLKNTINGKAQSQKNIEFGNKENTQGVRLNEGKDKKWISGNKSCLNFDGSIGDKKKFNKKAGENDITVLNLNKKPIGIITTQRNTKNTLLPFREKLSADGAPAIYQERIRMNQTNRETKLLQEKQRKQQKQRLLNAYSPCLLLCSNQPFVKELRKTSIPPNIFTFQKKEIPAIKESQNPTTKITISPSKLSPSKISPSRLYERAPIIKYIQMNHEEISKFNELIELEEFVDDKFDYRKSLGQFDGCDETYWKKTVFSEQNLWVLSGKLSLPKDFLRLKEESSQAPNSLINILNVLLYVDPCIIKSIIQPNNQNCYSSWYFLNHRFQAIFTDRNLPFDKHGNIPFVAGGEEVLWFNILLKLFAKALGGYDRVRNLSEKQAYKMITGIQPRAVRKGLIATVEDFKEHIVSQITRGYVPLYSKGNQLAIVKNVHGQNLIVLTPLRGEKEINVMEIFKENSEILLIRSQAHWFINTQQFTTSKQSLFSFEIYCQRQTRLYLSTNPIINKIYIYELVTVNKKKQQMNIKNESESNYLQANIRRGCYKIILQCGKKHVSEYFNEFKNPKKELKDEKKCILTIISCQEILIKRGDRIKPNGSESVEDQGSFYKVFQEGKSTHRKREFVSYETEYH